MPNMWFGISSAHEKLGELCGYEAVLPLVDTAPVSPLVMFDKPKLLLIK